MKKRQKNVFLKVGNGCILTSFDYIQEQVVIAAFHCSKLRPFSTRVVVNTLKLDFGQ